MRAPAHDVIRPASALDQMAHLGNFRLLDFHGSACQTVRAADFLHGLCGNCKRLIPDAEKNHCLCHARTTSLYDVLARNFHRAPAGTSLQIFAILFSIAPLISSRPSTSSTTPVLIASAGMPKITDVASSCAITWPPAAFTASTPLAASLPIPVS